MSPKPLTDYRVVERLVLGPRGGMTRVWKIETGPYHREVDVFASRREALEELALLVNEASEKTTMNSNSTINHARHEIHQHPDTCATCAEELALCVCPDKCGEIHGEDA